MSAAEAGRGGDDEEEAAVEHAGGETQRLDKWLWFVRVIKSRTQAAGLVTDGKVRVNRERVAKPGLTLRPGDVVTVTVRGHVRVLKMLAPGIRRGPPSEARLLYEDLTPPPPADASPRAQGSQAERQPGTGRPTKKERRQLDRLRDGDN